MLNLRTFSLAVLLRKTGAGWGVNTSRPPPVGSTGKTGLFLAKPIFEPGLRGLSLNQWGELGLLRLETPAPSCPVELFLEALLLRAGPNVRSCANRTLGGEPDSPDNHEGPLGYRPLGGVLFLGSSSSDSNQPSPSKFSACRRGCTWVASCR